MDPFIDKLNEKNHIKGYKIINVVHSWGVGEGGGTWVQHGGARSGKRLAYHWREAEKPGERREKRKEGIC